MSTLAPQLTATPHDSAALVGARARTSMLSAFAAGAVVLAAIAFGLIRQPCNDIGWHLATARVAAETGSWPVVNTFSHTHPSYPLDQQYPLFQTLLYGVYCAGGWAGLSFLNGAGWLGVFLLLVRWGGSWRHAICLHLPWMVALLALQRRMILRPDMLSMLFLGCELLVIDAYLRCSRSRDGLDEAARRFGAGRFRPLPHGRGSDSDGSVARRVGTAHHHARPSPDKVGSAHPTWRGRAEPTWRGWAWMLLLPLIHWGWANSHQLFPLSLAVQGLLIVHLLLARWGRLGVDARDRGVALVPPVVALVASLGVSLLTPLGTGILHVVANTSGSLAHHRADVQEFAYLWDRPWELQLAVVCGAMGLVALWRMRRQWPPLEVGLWLGTLVMMLGAVRGLVFFGPISVALLARSLTRTGAGNAASHPLIRWPALRGVMVAATCLLAGNVIFHRWVRPPLALGGTQPGLGRSRGDWPHGAVGFLRENPPPGRMMNLPWSLGSPLIWELPTMPVFVDARLEAYPRAFLVDCMAAEKDDAILARLTGEYRPQWIIANHRDADVRARLVQWIRTGGWSCVYADTLTLVLVQENADTQDYLHDRRIAVDALAPHDLLARPATLRARQRIHFARLLHDLGAADRARDQLTEAAEDVGGDSEITALVADVQREFDGS